MIYLINQIFKAIFPTCFFSPFAKFNDKKRGNYYNKQSTTLDNDNVQSLSQQI